MGRLRWKDFQEAADVRRAIQVSLPEAATSADVKRFGVEQQFECSEMLDGVIYCSTPARSGLHFVSAKWLIKFYFTGDHVERIEVEKGLIGL